MVETLGPEYQPLWLTAEEHEILFKELLAAPEGLRAERLAELLRRADARSGTLSMAPAQLSARRRLLAALLLGMGVLLAGFMYLLSRL